MFKVTDTNKDSSLLRTLSIFRPYYKSVMIYRTGQGQLYFLYLTVITYCLCWAIWFIFNKMVLLPPSPKDVCIIAAETLISFSQNGIRECSDNLNINCRSIYFWQILVFSTMEQRALKNVINHLNINIYSHLETSGGKRSNLYLNVVHFFHTSLK